MNDADIGPFPLPAVPPPLKKPEDAQRFARQVFSDFFSFNIAHARQRLEKTSPKEWEAAGKIKALAVFHAVAQRVPAYRDFLSENKINPEKIETFEDFQKVPTLDKNNYIQKYPIKDILWDGSEQHTQITAVSSGSTGKPFLWPRDTRLELEVTYFFELIFDSFFNDRNKRTLVVDCFAMGMYVGGPFFLNSHLRLAQKGYPITVVTPGNVMGDILRVVQELAPQFDQILLSGYPPFLKDVIENGIEIGINWENFRTILYPAGEGFSEAWRVAVAQIAGDSDQYTSFLGYYGTADAAVIGVETPWSIAFRKEISESLEKITAVFGQNRLPSVLNYVPTLRYLEMIGDEIHMTTANGAIPLVRYNIHDSGGLIPYDQAVEIIDGKYLKEVEKKNTAWQLPYVYVFGRSDHTAILYGANIYPENIKAALETGMAAKKCTGRFMMETEEDHHHNQHLNIHVECQNGVRPSQQLKKRLTLSIIEMLEEVNAEYANLRRSIEDKSVPFIFLHEYGDNRYFPREKKQQWNKHS